MEELLHSLNALNRSELPDDASIYLRGQQNPTIQKIANLASVVLFTDEGLNILENHRILIENGFPIFAGEEDAFGWVTGCIQTKKGRIMYG